MLSTIDSDYELAPTPSIDDLQTVEPLPFDTCTDWFDDTDPLLTSTAADAILSELWRHTRNPRLLEMELEARGQVIPDLQLSTIALRHIEDGVLDPTAVAREFADTARNKYSQEVVIGPEPQSASLVSPTELEPLAIH